MNTSPTHKGPLAGLRVVELAHVMAGPVGGLMLADMGAQVVKVEKLPGGDDTRRTTPPAINGESASFMILNRNKRGVAVDLKAEEGKEFVKRLIAQADIVIENRSEEHTSELQSLMRISYAVFCLNKKKNKIKI